MIGFPQQEAILCHIANSEKMVNPCILITGILLHKSIFTAVICVEEKDTVLLLRSKIFLTHLSVKQSMKNLAKCSILHYNLILWADAMTAQDDKMGQGCDQKLRAVAKYTAPCTHCQRWLPAKLQLIQRYPPQPSNQNNGKPLDGTSRFV